MGTRVPGVPLHFRVVVQLPNRRAVANNKMTKDVFIQKLTDTQTQKILFYDLFTIKKNPRIHVPGDDKNSKGILFR